MSTTLIGRWGEALAAEYLRKQGYQLLAANFHSRFGELDLVAKKKKILAFVEVKVRKNDHYGAACEFVTKSKQEKLILTAESFLQMNEPILKVRGMPLQPRFDVIEIYAPYGISDTYTINHMENAFE